MKKFISSSPFASSYVMTIGFGVLGAKLAALLMLVVLPIAAVAMGFGGVGAFAVPFVVTGIVFLVAATIAIGGPLYVGRRVTAETNEPVRMARRFAGAIAVPLTPFAISGTGWFLYTLVMQFDWLWR